MAEVLDGGCVLYRLPVREKPVPKTRRPMTPEEREMALSFADFPSLQSSAFAMAMVKYAANEWPITERQAAGIHAVGRTHTSAPLRKPAGPGRIYVPADIPALRAELEAMDDDAYALIGER
jgi:hypothetical protein